VDRWRAHSVLSRPPSIGEGWGGGYPFPSRLGGLGERRELPQRGPGPKTNLLHSRAVRKPLMGIILSVLKCMFYTTYRLKQLAQTNMMKSAPEVYIDCPPARGSGGITAGFGKMLKFINAKSSTAFTTEADVLLCKFLISDLS